MIEVTQTTRQMTSDAASPLVQSAFAIAPSSEGLQYLVILHEEVGIVACVTLGGVHSMV